MADPLCLKKCAKFDQGSGKKNTISHTKNHPDLQAQKYAKRFEKYYSPKVNIPRESKPAFDSLLASTGKTISELVLEAVEEKYNVTLRSDNNKNTDDRQENE